MSKEGNTIKLTVIDRRQVNNQFIIKESILTCNSEDTLLAFQAQILKEFALPVATSDKMSLVCKDIPLTRTSQSLTLNGLKDGDTVKVFYSPPAKGQAPNDAAYCDDVFFGPCNTTMRQLNAKGPTEVDDDAWFAPFVPCVTHDHKDGVDPTIEPFKMAATARHYYVVPSPVAKPYTFLNKPTAAEIAEAGKKDPDAAFAAGHVLMKSDDDKAGTLVQCIGSGRRSAILKNPDTNHWLRLKGCGDLYQGFHFIEADESYGTKARELLSKVKGDEKSKGTEGVKIFQVRGSNFLHMATRELNMTADINAAIHTALAALPQEFKPTFCPSMEPLGLWNYQSTMPPLQKEALSHGGRKEDSDEKSEETVAPADETTPNKAQWLQPSCDVLRCYGERRLESHFVRGLERMTKILFQSPAKAGPNANVKEVNAELTKIILNRFPEMRREGTTAVGEPWLAFVTVAQSVYATATLAEAQETLKGNFVDLTGLIDDLAAFEKTPLVQQGPKVAWPSAVEAPVSGFLKTSDANYKKHWDALCGSIFSSTLPKTLKELLVLARRLGQEAGFYLHTLQANNISWGTYDDALGTHCNAHSNNLCVVHPKAHEWRVAPGGSYQAPADPFILAPLDFDMAQHQKDTLLPANTWTDNMATEPQGLGLCIGRCMMNSGAEDFEEFKDTDPTDPTCDAEANQMRVLTVYAIRDAMLVGYFEGMHCDKKEMLPKFTEVPQQTRDFLIPMALILTESVRA